MNPATDRLTVLLLSDDPALLADECGTCPPLMLREPDAEDEWLRNWHLPGWSPLIPCGLIERALVLVRDGVIVQMGWDRVRTLLAQKLGLDPTGGVVIEPIRVGLRARWILRTWDDGSRIVTDDVDSLDLRDLAPAVAAILGARVVLLRDGREVTE